MKLLKYKISAKTRNGCYYVFFWSVKHIDNCSLLKQEKIPSAFGSHWPKFTKSKKAAMTKLPLDTTLLSRE